MQPRRPSRRWKIALVTVAVYFVLLAVQVLVWSRWRQSHPFPLGSFSEIPGAPWPSQLHDPSRWPTKPEDVRRANTPVLTKTTARGELYLTQGDPRLPRGFNMDTSFGFSQEVVTVGWPLRAWIEEELIGSLPTSNPGPFRDSLVRRPMWVGLFVNGVIYTIPTLPIIWFTLNAWENLRVRRCLAHNLCPTCAYPRGTSPVCTECGHPFN